MVRDTARSHVEAEAAAWLARLHGPYRSADTDAALKAWLKADPAHEEAFGRATEIWELLPGIDVVREPELAEPDRRFGRRAVFAMAASACSAWNVVGAATPTKSPSCTATTPFISFAGVKSIEVNFAP